jgi:hypothetical protein
MLTVDLHDAKSEHHRDRMNGQGRKQFMDERVPFSFRCAVSARAAPWASSISVTTEMLR